MLIPSFIGENPQHRSSLSRRVNANSQRPDRFADAGRKLIKKGEC